MIDAFTNVQSMQSLPLLSEILARVDTDQALPDKTRAAAVSLAKALRREKALNEAAYATVAIAVTASSAFPGFFSAAGSYRCRGWSLSW